jgi:hypothetical protein
MRRLDNDLWNHLGRRSSYMVYKTLAVGGSKGTFLLEYVLGLLLVCFHSVHMITTAARRPRKVVLRRPLGAESPEYLLTSPPLLVGDKIGYPSLMLLSACNQSTLSLSLHEPLLLRTTWPYLGT